VAAKKIDNTPMRLKARLRVQFCTAFVLENLGKDNRANIKHLFERQSLWSAKTHSQMGHVNKP